MIAVVFGGCSVEHEISILSTLQTLKYLNKDDYLPVYMSKENRFYVGECLSDFDFYAKTNLKKCREVIFEKEAQEVYLKYAHSFKKRILIEWVLPLLHGTSGEDGCIQGYMELLNLPYAQSKLSTCALFMDKDLMHKMFRALEIPGNEAITLHKNEILHDLDKLKDIDLPKPWIVKPAKGGSSIGINCIYDDDKMNRLICESFAFDNKLILEHKLENVREFNLAVIGDSKSQILSHIEEIHIDHDYYSYSDKYGGSVVKQQPATRTIPAQIDEQLANEIRELSRKAFIDFECSGVVRFDYLYDDHLMMNEINIIPGSLSMYLFRNILTPQEMLEILKKCAMEKQLEKTKEIREIESFVFKKNWHQYALKK